MKTAVSKEGHEVSIGDNGSTILIDSQINLTGKKRLAESLRAGDLSIARELAFNQVKDGAAVLDANVVAPGINEMDMLPRAV